MLHRVVSVALLLLVPLPFLALGRSRRGLPLKGAGVWKGLVGFANFTLLAMLGTGLYIYPQFFEGKTVAAAVLVFALGAALGIMSKALKLYSGGHFGGSRSHQLKKVAYAGFSYLAVLLIVFGMMANWYEM